MLKLQSSSEAWLASAEPGQQKETNFNTTEILIISTQVIISGEIITGAHMCLNMSTEFLFFALKHMTIAGTTY